MVKQRSAASEQEAMLKEIHRHCFILYVTVHQWIGQYLIRGAKIVDADGKEVPENFRTGGRWKLMPDRWHRRLQAFVGRIRSTVYRRSVMFRDGIYVVPKAAVVNGVTTHPCRDLVEAIKGLREKYKQEAQLISAGLLDYKLQLQRPISEGGLGDYYEELSGHIPSPEKFVALHDVELGIWPIGGFETDHHMDIDSAESWIVEAQEATTRMVQERVNALLQEPLQELCEVIDTIDDVLKRDSHLKSLDRLQSAYNKAMSFAFMAPPELISKMNEIGRRLGDTSVQDVNRKTPSGAGLRQSLRELNENVKAGAEAYFRRGQFSRNLDL